jgi:hypothetical protein
MNQHGTPYCVCNGCFHGNNLNPRCKTQASCCWARFIPFVGPLICCAALPDAWCCPGNGIPVNGGCWTSEDPEAVRDAVIARHRADECFPVHVAADGGLYRAVDATAGEDCASAAALRVAVVLASVPVEVDANITAELAGVVAACPVATVSDIEWQVQWQPPLVVRVNCPSRV